MKGLREYTKLVFLYLCFAFNIYNSSDSFLTNTFDFLLLKRGGYISASSGFVEGDTDIDCSKKVYMITGRYHTQVLLYPDSISDNSCNTHCY